MKRKIFIVLTSIMVAATLITGCGKQKDVQSTEVQQGDVKTDENKLIELLVEYINEDVNYANGFTIKQYQDSLDENNLTFELQYDRINSIAHIYSSEYGGVDRYTSGMNNYWYNKNENCWYVQTGSNKNRLEISDFINFLSTAYTLKLGKDEQFNSTNCYTLNATVPIMNSGTKEVIKYENYTYYVDKKSYNLLGVKDSENGYIVLNKDTNLTMPEGTENAKSGNYQDYLTQISQSSDDLLFTIDGQ